jgi:hypothetical protein
MVKSGQTNRPWRAVSGSTASWRSPQKLADSSSLVLVSEMNDWRKADRRTFAPHGENGPSFSRGTG